MVAAQQGHLDICRWLVEEIKVQINESDEDNDTALDIAVMADQ